MGGSPVRIARGRPGAGLGRAPPPSPIVQAFLSVLLVLAEKAAKEDYPHK